MLMPKRVKWRKQQRGRMTGKALRGAEISFGDWGLQALEPGWVTARQIEAARRTIVHAMKRRGKIWIRVFPDKPYTQKPPETRMGKGKGGVEYYVAVVKPGRIMFEISGLTEDLALDALKQATYKFSIRTKVVSKHELGGEQQ
jgi:large subunit ribosomal protein L16